MSQMAGHNVQRNTVRNAALEHLPNMLVTNLLSSGSFRHASGRKQGVCQSPQSNTVAVFLYSEALLGLFQQSTDSPRIFPNISI
jgi:hypothetical protein